MVAANCPSDQLRAAESGDEIGGQPARLVANPGTPDQVSRVLARCARDGMTVAPRGAGTKLDWGPPPARVDVLVDLAGLTGPVEHQPENHLATFPAGTRVRAAKAAVNRSGQRLAVDPGSAAATIGGLLATDEAGPLRHRFGAPSRQVVSVDVVLPDGALTTLGPDLAALVCGASGSLAVIVSGTFRLSPRPARRVWLTRPIGAPLELRDLVGSLAAADLPVAAVEVDLPTAGQPGTLCVLVEGADPMLAVTQAAVTRLLGSGVVASQAAPLWWGAYPFDNPQDIALRVTLPPAEMHTAIYVLRDAVGHGVLCRGSAGVGTLHAVLPGRLSVAEVTGVLEVTRHTLLARGGSLVVVRAPERYRDVLDLTGAETSTMGYRLKQAFDPTGQLARDFPLCR